MHFLFLKIVFPVEAVQKAVGFGGFGGGGGDNGYSSTNGQLLYIKIVFQYEIRE